MEKELVITSPTFVDGGKMPVKHTQFAENLSPEFDIQGLSDEAKSLALIMDDLDIPMTSEFNHWVIWNIPAMATIPEGIPQGEVVSSLGEAIQGLAYGKNRYAGPKQPVFIRSRHRYKFTIYALDTMLDLPASCGKTELLKAMSGHVLQQGSITGTYKRGEA